MVQITQDGADVKEAIWDTHSQKAKPAAEPIAVKNWETRSAAAVRTSGLAERRFHGVA